MRSQEELPLRSGAAAESARLRRCRNGREELHRVLGQGRPGGASPSWRSGAAERSYSESKVRGGGREELSHVQGAVAARAQEGLEELLHIEGQEGRR